MTEVESLIETLKDKDRQLNNWYLAYHKLKEDNEQLKKHIETQKSINKDYVDEVYNYQKELEECEIEYQSLVDFVNEKNPALLQEYAIQRLRSKGATVIKLKGGD